MKKLTFAFACASTLALFATDFSVATFEAAGLLGKTVGGKTDAGGTNGDIYWQYKRASGSEDGSLVTAYGGENLSAPTGSQLSGTPGDNYLNLSTEGGTLWRSVNPNASDLGAAQNIDDAKGLFIDTMVQFTATEDGGTPEIAQDENGNYIDKLAIWLAAEEGKAPALCVMGCAMTTEGSGRNEVPVATPTTFKLTGADIQAGTWYRLTVQAIKNIVDQNGFQGDFVSGFVVRIDGKPLSVAAPETVCDSKFTTYYEGGLAGDAAALIAAGQFIPSLTGYQNEDKSALQAVGFKGSGAIDDLKITDENPIPPAAEPVGFTIETAADMTASWSTTADGEFKAYAAGAKAEPGKIYVKLATADGGVKIVEQPIVAGEANALDLTGETVDWSWYLGDADADGAYVIDDQTEFGKFVAKVAALGSEGITFKLAENVTFAGVIGAADNKDNLGKEDFIVGAFKGTFDGQNKTISDVLLPRADYTGLFGSLYGATVKNLTVAVKDGTTGFESEGGTTDFCGGLVAGVSVKSTIENVTTAAGTFKAQKAAAGIVGYAAGGTILKGCVNNLNVISMGNEKVAGLVGCAQNSGTYEPAYVTIDGCMNNGNVECQASNKTRAALLVSYTDCLVKFQGTSVAQGTVTQVGSTGDIQSIININGGSATVVDGAVITAPAGMKSTIHNGKPHAGLNYATVADGVATFVADSAAANGANLKVMTTGNTITLPNVGDSITLDTTLATATVKTTAENAEVKTEGNVYTVVAKTVAVTGVTLDKTEVTNAKVGDSITLVATVAPENATDKTVTWETSDAEVATVANGVVTILKAGTVTITAKAGEHSATCAITVKAAYPTYIGDDAAKQAKYDTWAGLYGADTESANEEAFLLNVAPAEAETEKGKFVITSITVGADGTVTVVAPAKNSKGAAFNGTVEVQGATALDGEWAPKATGHKFFKAVLK